MWHIELVDIAGSGLVVGFDTSVDTLLEAEIIAANDIRKHLGVHDIELSHYEDLVYDVWNGGLTIGVVHIHSR